MSATDGASGSAENGWGTRPTEQRQAELKETLRKWDAEKDHYGHRGPFDGEPLNGSDVFWLANHVEPTMDATENKRSFYTPSARAVPLVLSNLHLEGAILSNVRLEKARLPGVHLEGANLWKAHLQEADLWKAHLQKADLRGARLQGVNFVEAHLQEADLTGTMLDRESSLDGAYLNQATLDRVAFDNIDLSGVKWGEVRELGNELWAKRRPRRSPVELWTRKGVRIDSQTLYRREQYGMAARTYRALSLALRNQGINDAARFRYRSEVMERKVIWYEMVASLRSWHFYRAARPGAVWSISWALGFFTGYGHYISRLFGTYVGVLVAFAAIYLGVTYQPARGHPLPALPWSHIPAAISWIRDVLSFCIVRVPAAVHASTPSHLFDVLIFSVTAFHGRGLQQMQNLSEVVIWWAGVEAVLGLLIEALFVAAFARRVTGG